MSIQVSILDDPEVGQSSNTFFKPTPHKQRVSFLPAFISKASLVPTQALKEKAASGDESALDEVQHLIQLGQLLEEGANKETPTVLRAVKPEEGYYFSRNDSHVAHYNDTMRYFLCKAFEYKALKRSPVCCEKDTQGSQLMRAFVLLVYETDMEGNILKLAPEAQRPLDATNKLDFKYKIQTWSINDVKVKGLKQFRTQFPPVSCDYEVWEQSQGASKRVMFSPCPPPAVWRKRGPVLEERIVLEAAKAWEDAHKALGKNLSVQQIDEMYGLAVPPAKPKVEKNYSGLLGG